MLMDDSKPVGSSLETSQLGLLPVDMQDDSEGTYSDAVESMHESSPSNSSAVAEDDVPSDGPSLDRSILGWETVDGKMAIAFFPDIIVYQDTKWHCTNLKVIFSGNFVRIDGSTAHENEKGFSIELAIEDMIDIKSQRCGRNEMVEVKLNVIARKTPQDMSATSSVEELTFYVVDSLWYDKIEEIVSLNVKYKAMWNYMIDTDTEMDLEALLGQKAIEMPKKFFPKFGDNFEEVVYPVGDPDAVSISMRDVDLLKPDTFINDTLIDFYIKYLKNNKLFPEERDRYHFFNCFFFRKLADMDKDPSSAFEGRAAFLRVRKWTRKVNLFDKDYIFIPVNYNYHWSLIVICHPGEIANIADEDVEKLARVPCILHMDSFRGSHGNLKDLIQSYLCEEWKERQKEINDDVSSKFQNLRFVPLELPQQQNLYDCGLFLLHYIELFLEEAPANFSPFMMVKSETPNFLKNNWFPPDEPYTKRSAIIRLIYDLVNRRHQPFPGSSEKCCASNDSKSNDDEEIASSVIGKRLSPSKDGDQQMPTADGSQGIEMNLLQASSFRSSEHGNDSGLVLREFLEPSAQYQVFGRTPSFSGCRSDLPSPEEEGVEADLRFVHATSTDIGFQHPGVINPKASAQYVSEENTSASDQRSSLEEQDNTNSFPAEPTCDSGDTSAVVNEKCSSGASSSDDKVENPNSVPMENLESLRASGSPPSVADGPAASQAPSHIVVHDESADPPICCSNNPSEISLQNDDSVVQENNGITSEQLAGNELEAEHHHVAKKMRLLCPLEMEREFSTTVSEDLHL